MVSGGANVQAPVPAPNWATSAPLVRSISTMMRGSGNDMKTVFCVRFQLTVFE